MKSGGGGDAACWQVRIIFLLGSGSFSASKNGLGGSCSRRESNDYENQRLQVTRSTSKFMQVSRFFCSFMKSATFFSIQFEDVS